VAKIQRKGETSKKNEGKVKKAPELYGNKPASAIGDAGLLGISGNETPLRVIHRPPNQH